MGSKLNKVAIIDKISKLRYSVSTQERSRLFELPIHELMQELNDSYTPHNLELHERYYDANINKEILRVPNGWIYSDYDSSTDNLYNSVFVNG